MTNEDMGSNDWTIQVQLWIPVTQFDKTTSENVTWKLDDYHLQLASTDVLRSNLGFCFSLKTYVFICEAFFFT